VTPQVSRKAIKSAIDGRMTLHPGCFVSMKLRKRIEEGFDWLKTVGGLRKTKLIRPVAWVACLARYAQKLPTGENLRWN
jgi:2-keto-3-deoxy-6-phosphogluconate aldolase